MEKGGPYPAIESNNSTAVLISSSAMASLRYSLGNKMMRKGKDYSSYILQQIGAKGAIPT